MVAKDLMRREVLTVPEDTTVEDLIEIIVREHIHGVPVVDDTGTLVGMATQQDVFFSPATLSRAQPGSAAAKSDKARVRDIMTSPAVAASEDVDILELCRMMHRLRIHRLPIVNEGKVSGIISSLDICGAVGRGEDLG